MLDISKVTAHINPVAPGKYKVARHTFIKGLAFSNCVNIKLL